MSITKLPSFAKRAPAGVSPNAVMGLNDWPLGEPAVLHTFVEAPDAQTVKTLRRLAEFGFQPGESLRVVSRGWLRGSPIAVRVGEATFALRAHEAALLRVRAAEGLA